MIIIGSTVVAAFVVVGPCRQQPWPDRPSRWWRRTHTRTLPCPQCRRLGADCPSRCRSFGPHRRRPSHYRWLWAVCRSRSTAACVWSRPSPSWPRPQCDPWSLAVAPARCHPIAVFSRSRAIHRCRRLPTSVWSRSAVGDWAQTPRSRPRPPPRRASRTPATWRCPLRPTLCPSATATTLRLRHRQRHSL